MKYFILKAICEYLRKFERITSVLRISDSILCVHFDRQDSVCFDLTRQGSMVFIDENNKPSRDYHAPFDLMLKKRFNGALVTDISLLGSDKILRISALLKGAYKQEISILQLEFTGRHTNAIILDENGVILEALRHVDADASYRIVKPGVTLLGLLPYTGPLKKGNIENVHEYLVLQGKERIEKRLRLQKDRHAKALHKKIARLQKELDSLPPKEVFEKDAKEYSFFASVVLANLYKIKPYDTKLETYDFDGKEITIPLPKLPNPKRLGEHFYSLSKRAASKAKNLHIEEQNLSSRKAFYKRMLDNLKMAKSEEQINVLFPAKPVKKRKKEHLQCELFWIDGYRVLVGRNERENIWVLKHAKSADMWLHLKDRPSAHCIVQSGGKRQIAKEAIAKAAQICVQTSVTQPGDYLVDITYRRNVKMQEGAHVTYVKYDTMKIKKE